MEAVYLFGKARELAFAKYCAVHCVLCEKTDVIGVTFRGKLCFEEAKGYLRRLIVLPCDHCRVLFQKVRGLIFPIALVEGDAISDIASSEIFFQKYVKLAWIINTKILREHLTSIA
jgi:hypothetical protein